MEKYEDNVRRFPRTVQIPKHLRPSVEALESEAFDLIEPVRRGYKANVAIGRVFVKMKKVIYDGLGHGFWELYYADRYGTSGIPIRLATTYMNLARKEDAAAKTGKSPVLEERSSAEDPQAVDTRSGNVKAVVKESGLSRTYKIPLLLTPEEQAATQLLIKAPASWRRARREMKAILLKHLGMPVRFPRLEEKRDRPAA